jgi:hypothetical protein
VAKSRAKLKKAEKRREHNRKRLAARHHSRQLSNLERFDPHAPLRNKLRELAPMRDQWAGIPLPLGGENLVVEPSHPLAAALNERPETPAEAEAAGWKHRNTFWSWHWRSDIVVMEKDGKIDFGKVPSIHGLSHALSTLGCSDAWGIEQESRALQTLAEHVTHRQFKQYLLTGTFIEESHRSRVVYLFRKLRPTVALRPQKDDTHILACLCMHPIAYYEGSWAGAMCPTDDVLAHLLLMRGDEHMFWKRCNQHPAYRKESGL